MNITKVVVQPLTGNSSGRLLAFANLIVENQYAINGLRIVRNRDGTLDVLYPSLHAPERYKRKGYRTLYAVVPMCAAAHKRIQQIVLDAYEETQRDVKKEPVNDEHKTETRPMDTPSADG